MFEFVVDNSKLITVTLVTAVCLCRYIYFPKARYISDTSRYISDTPRSFLEVPVELLQAQSPIAIAHFNSVITPLPESITTTYCAIAITIIALSIFLKYSFCYLGITITIPAWIRTCFNSTLSCFSSTHHFLAKIFAASPSPITSPEVKRKSSVNISSTHH